jgi:alpha-L-fucosidase
VASTHRDNKIFIHILAWPDDSLKLPALPAKILKTSVLTGGQAALKQTDGGVEVFVADSDRQEIDTIVVLELDQPVAGISPIAVGSIGQSLTEGKKATASNVYQKDQSFAAAMAVDGDDATRWATDASTGPCWLEVDLGKPETFDRARIDECVEWGVRVKAFELQAKEGEAWRTFYGGKAIGKQLEIRFAPVTARVVRLNIVEGQGGPTIFEFQLFAPTARKTSQ